MLLDRCNTEITGSNPTQAMDVYQRYIYALWTCLGRNREINQSTSQVDLLKI
jgi:hypothetical protein